MTATIIERDEAAWVTEDRYRYMRVVEVADRIVRIRITCGADPVPSHARAEVLDDNKTWTHLAFDPPDNWIATTAPPSPTVDAAKELGALAERLIHRAAEILGPAADDDRPFAPRPQRRGRAAGHHLQASLSHDRVMSCPKPAYSRRTLPVLTGSVLERRST